MACYPRAQETNITLEQLPNVRPQVFMQLGFWELSADQGVEDAYQGTWARGQSRAGGGQVPQPAFADWGRWAAVPREKSCLDTREGVVFWKLLSEWVSRAVSQGTGACQREEQIVLLFFSLLLLRSITHYLEVRHQPWEAFFWVEYFLTFLFLRKFSSLPCFCFVKACMWQQGLEEKTEQANMLSLQAWPEGAFHFQAGKAAAIATLFIRTHWPLSLQRRPLLLLSSLLCHKYQTPFLAEVTSLAHT